MEMMESEGMIHLHSAPAWGSSGAWWGGLTPMGATDCDSRCAAGHQFVPLILVIRFVHWFYFS